MSIVLRPAAEADLVAIADYIAQDSPTRAQAFVERLRQRCAILERTPLAGRSRPDLGSGLRSLVQRPYLIVYRVIDDRCEIVGFIHGARDLPGVMAERLLEDDD